MYVWLRGAVVGALTSFFLLTAASGCVKFDRASRIEEAIRQHQTAVEENEPIIRCDAYAPLAKPMKLAQYPALRQTLGDLATDFTQERLVQAHVDAMKATVKEIRLAVLKTPGGRSKAKMLDEKVAEIVNYGQPKPDEDLDSLLKAGHIAENDPCASLYLEHFYANYVKALDPFATLEHLADASQLHTDAAGAQSAANSIIRLADGPIAEAGVRDLGDGVVWLTFRRWDMSDALLQSLRTVRERIESQVARVLVLDLRLAGGDDLQVLEQMRAYARSAWRDLPMVIWVDRYTRGTPEAFAAEFAYSNPRALTVGQRTFGYARLPCSRELFLADGTQPVRLTLGCTQIQSAAGQSPDGAGLKTDVSDISVPGLALDVDLELAKERDTTFKRNGLSPIQRGLPPIVAVPVSDLASGSSSGREEKVQNVISASAESRVANPEQRVLDMGTQWAKLWMGAQ